MTFESTLIIRRKIGDGIRNERVRQGMSMYALAKQTNLQPSTIRDVEKGLSGATIDALAKISEALLIDIRVSHSDAK